MKKVLILFGKSNWRKSRPFSNKKYMYSYEYFYDLCKKNGIQMYRASYQWYNFEKKVFSHAWIFEEKGGVWSKVENIKPDLIFDRTKPNLEQRLNVDNISVDFEVFNNTEFTKIIDNKLNTSLLFSKWSKKNFIVNKNDDLERIMKKIKSRKIVLKPIDQSGGANVIIGEKKYVAEKIKKEKIKINNWIIQEFIDSSKGIPGIMKGIHDLRIVLVNDDVAYSYFRKPAEGSLLANIAQGGAMEIIPIEKIPNSIFSILERAKDIFSGFENKLYTIDLMFDEDGKPWIVELNSMPGMYFEPGQEKTRESFYLKLLELFK